MAERKRSLNDQNAPKLLFFVDDTALFFQLHFNHAKHKLSNIWHTVIYRKRLDAPMFSPLVPENQL